MERDDNQQEQTSSTPEETSTSQTTTPSTQQNVTPSTDTEGRTLYLSVLTDKNREIARLQQELEDRKKEPPKPITQEQEQTFFTNPLTSTKELIRQELQEQLSPFRQFIEQNSRVSKYDQLKNQIKLSQLGNLLKENEQIVDQLMQGADPTEATISAAIFQAAGLRASGMLGNQPAPQTQSNVAINNNPTPQNNQPPINMSVPPHLRPSAPPAPRENNNQPNYPPLTENERTLMRLWGMNEKQYREGQVRNDDNVGALIIEPDTTASVNQKSTNKDRANV